MTHHRDSSYFTLYTFHFTTHISYLPHNCMRDMISPDTWWFTWDQIPRDLTSTATDRSTTTHNLPYWPHLWPPTILNHSTPTSDACQYWSTSSWSTLVIILITVIMISCSVVVCLLVAASRVTYDVIAVDPHLTRPRGVPWYRRGDLEVTRWIVDHPRWR